MTLREISQGYQESAEALRVRIVELRAQAQLQTDDEAVRSLRRRIGVLVPIWRETRELALLTAHYYDRRSFCKDEEYIF